MARFSCHRNRLGYPKTSRALWISPSNTALEFNVRQTPFVEEHAMKMDILRAANYTYNFARQLYFNRDAKKAFSFPFLDDHSEDEVLHSINESTDRSAWK